MTGLLGGLDGVNPVGLRDVGRCGQPRKVNFEEMPARLGYVLRVEIGQLANLVKEVSTAPQPEVARGGVVMQ